MNKSDGGNGLNTDKNKKSLLDRAVDTFDLPGEVLSGMLKLTVTGNRRLHVECHKGILEYDGSLISINGGSMIITIRGEGLDIISMSAEEILVKGFIAGIDFE
jgi:sporulation protein YqfC